MNDKDFLISGVNFHLSLKKWYVFKIIIIITRKQLIWYGHVERMDPT